MVSKNTIAVLVILTLLISIMGTIVIIVDFDQPDRTSGTGQVKVNVIERPRPPTGLVTLNVIEKEVNENG